jgi:hypothetical protein
MLEAEWSQVLLGNVSTGANEDELSTGRIWFTGFQNVTARSCLAGVLKLTKHFFNFPIFVQAVVNCG